MSKKLPLYAVDKFPVMIRVPAEVKIKLEKLSKETGVSVGAPEAVAAAKVATLSAREQRTILTTLQPLITSAQHSKRAQHQHLISLMRSMLRVRCQRFWTQSLTLTLRTLPTTSLRTALKAAHSLRFTVDSVSVMLNSTHSTTSKWATRLLFASCVVQSYR